MSHSLTMASSLADELLSHARSELPNEACGLVGGDRAAGRATSYHRTRNRHASPLRFDVHPEDLVRAMFAIEAAGEDLVAIFHSHTGTPATPSATDVRDARYDAVYLIGTVSAPNRKKGELRAWRIDGGAATEIPLRVSASARGAGTPPSARG